MKKKGYFAAFLLCVLAVSAFLFWPEKGEKEESEAEEVQKKQIYVLCAYETKLHQQILKEVAENYSSRSGCAKVNMEFIPKENFKKEICLRMDNGRTADLIICDNGMMPALIDMGVFADISAYVETCCQDSMNFQKLWNTTMDDGKYYGIPFTCDPYVLFYNSDVFRENGLSAPEDWDGLLDTCSALQDSVGDKFGFAAKRPEEIYAFYRALLYACGGSLNTIDQEGGIRAAGILEELKRSRYVGKQTINLTEADVARSFAEGKVLMMAIRLSAWARLPAGARRIASDAVIDQNTAWANAMPILLMTSTVKFHAINDRTWLAMNNTKRPISSLRRSIWLVSSINGNDISATTQA